VDSESVIVGQLGLEDSKVVIQV